MSALAVFRMAYRTLLFDLDGTLVDAFTTIHRAYKHTLPLFGYPAPTMAQVRNVVGGGGTNAMSQFLPAHLVNEALAVQVAYTKTIMLEDVVPLPGALSLLQSAHARGATLAVYSNKGGDISRPICDHLGFSPYLAAVYGAGDTPWIKPQPELAAHVLTELKADPASTLLIGDSPFDIASAHTGGFACWCVTTGTHSAEQLEADQADRVFPDFATLWPALEAEL